ncbi:MAG TPA: hypothetical protein V6D22_07260 [Candidatus Obscuribacterales bacterium]
MHIANRLDVDAKEFFSRREDLSFIVRFNWKTSNHLKEAIQVLLASRLENTDTDASVKVERKRSDVLDDNEFRQIRRIIASNPNTPPAVLAYLAKNSDADILERIAENPRTPLNTLERLARSSSPVVRAAVAENINVSPDILTILGTDPDDDVRYHLAENPHLPEELLVALTEDLNPYVRYRAEATLLRVSGGMVLTGTFARAVIREEWEQGIR